MVPWSAHGGSPDCPVKILCSLVTSFEGSAASIHNESIWSNAPAVYHSFHFRSVKLCVSFACNLINYKPVFFELFFLLGINKFTTQPSLVYWVSIGAIQF